MQTPQPSSQIHILRLDPKPSLALRDNLPNEVQRDNDGRSKVVLEESLRIGRTPNREQTRIESRDDRQDTQAETEIRAPNAVLSAEGDLLETMALSGPAASETDMGEADAAPDEEVGEAGQGEQPGEDYGARGG